MSDLTATNCGCSSCHNSSIFGGNNSCNIIWIIILLSLCGNGCGCGMGSGLFGGSRSGCGCDDCNNNSCEWLIWILLISCFCGNSGHSCC